MRKIDRGAVGIADGETMLFSDFADGGTMWTGEGERTVRRDIPFDAPFLDPPVVKVWVSMLDLSNQSNVRLDVRAEAIERDRFAAVVSTWGDSRVARVRIAWLAIGQAADEEVWDVD